MIKKIINHSIIKLSILSLLISGCKDIDFGQKALNYVENESRKDSEKLVDNDLKVRFQNAFNFGSLEAIHRLETIKNGMNEHISLIELLNSKSKNLSDQEAAINKLSFVKISVPTLLELKRQIEQNSIIVKNLKNMCQDDYLKSSGITALGIVSPLASFREIEELSNQFKTQIKIQAILSNDPSTVGNNNDSTAASIGAGVASGVACILLGAACPASGFLISAVFSITYSVISFVPGLIARDKIKEQKRLLSKALNLYPQNVLSTEEVLKVSHQYCHESKEHFSQLLSDIGNTQQDYESSWYKLYEETMNQLNSAESYLIPNQIEAIMNSVIGTNLLNEQDVLEFENKLILDANIKMTNLIALYQSIQKAKNCDSDFELIEKYSEKLNEFKNQFSFYKKSKSESLVKYFSVKLKNVDNQIKSIPKYISNASERKCEL